MSSIQEVASLRAALTKVNASLEAERTRAHDLANRCQVAEFRVGTLEEALASVMVWYDNWDAPWADDEEWCEDEVKIRAALSKGEQNGS